MIRHIAYHELETPDGIIEMGVVDMEDDKVVGWHRMEGEEPMTEWRGGRFKLKVRDVGIED